jgi:hypothetical protein
LAVKPECRHVTAPLRQHLATVATTLRDGAPFDAADAALISDAPRWLPPQSTNHSRPSRE